MPATMYQKLVATRYHDTFRGAVAIVTAPLTQPQAGELLIRNRYAGVNAGFDTLSCQGKVPYINLVPPFDVGVEAVGEVVAIGLGVTGFQVGDAVATTGRGGGYREYQRLPAQQVIPIPSAIPEILTLMPTGVSALVALEQAGEMGQGETVLITAAAGGTGHLAVQLALLAGNRVIAVCGSDAKAQRLQTLPIVQQGDRPGLRIVNYRRESLDAVLAQEYPQGIDLMFDCVGQQVFDTGLKHLAVRGRLVVVGFISEYAAGLETVTQPRVYEQLFWKAASVRGFLMPHYAKHFAAARDRLLALFHTGQLQVWVDPQPFVGIAAIPDAVEYLLSGQSCGKVVVQLAN